VLQTVRAGVSLCGVLMFYAALQRIPLADAVTLQFTMPLFQIVLAALFLGEIVRRAPALATLAGFAGAVIVTRPGGADFDIGFVCALAAAFLFTVTQTMMKRLTAIEHTETMALWSAYVSILVMLLPALAHWRTPSETEWALIACASVLGTLSMLSWIAGLRVGEVTVCGPFDYTQILFAGLIGFLLFGEVPDGPTLLGAAVIVASTLYMARREAAAPRSERPR
jgi:drug/metabolite transporter (DMT)-like permease